MDFDIDIVDAADVIDPDKTQKIKPISRVRTIQILEAVRPLMPSPDDVNTVDALIERVVKGAA